MQAEAGVLDRAHSGSPDPKLARAHLAKICESSEFAGSPRLGRFLTFVVETALAGNGDQIKESLIAVEVYGRRPDYNPQIDSTVRVEAGRLRTRLRQYYEASGRDDLLQFDIPKGSYAPAFNMRAPATIAAENPSEIDVDPPKQKRFRLWHVLAFGVAITIAIIGVLYFKGVLRGHSHRLDSIAVLPFVNLSNNPANDRLCDGLMEDLTNALARFSNLRVPARTTMMQYKDRAFDLNRFGKDHRVRAVLEGSLRRDGDHLRVTTQLVDTVTGYHLWADSFERDVRDSPVIQHELASRIAAGLRTLVQNDTGTVHSRDQIDADTLDTYHHAQELLRIPVMKDGVPDSIPDSVLQSVRLFTEVTQRSPRFAKGWVGLAEAAEWEYELRGNKPAERLALAKSAVRKAIDLEPDLTQAWTLLTSILFFREWDVPGAEAACRRAIELDPRNTSARQRHVEVLRVQGRMKEAQFEIDRAIQLQPAAAGLRLRKALMLYQSGDVDAAAREAETAAKLTNLMPVYPMALWVQGLCLQQKGRLSEAEAIFRTGLAHQPHDPWNEPALGHLYAMSGRSADAEGILAELQSQLRRGRMTHVLSALVYTALGRHDDALAALEQAWTDRDDSIMSIALDPRFRPLHSKTRFKAIVERLRRASTMRV